MYLAVFKIIQKLKVLHWGFVLWADWCHFTNVLRAAFKYAITKSAINTVKPAVCLFGAFGIAHKSCAKNVGEIHPWLYAVGYPSV